LYLIYNIIKKKNKANIKKKYSLTDQRGRFYKSAPFGIPRKIFDKLTNKSFVGFRGGFSKWGGAPNHLARPWGFPFLKAASQILVFFASFLTLLRLL